MERAVGLFVTAGLACLAYFAFQLGATSIPQSQTVPLLARFTSAAGLNSGAQILIAGVPVGTVGPMRLDNNFYALVELHVRKDLALPIDTVAAIRGRGLLGDKYVALTPGAEDKTLAAGDRITDTESALDIESLLSRFAFGSVQNQNAPQNPPSQQATPENKPPPNP
jgi:phospholipid/cholesterol/gamma-HCH transport system substrate-binding protein